MTAATAGATAASADADTANHAESAWSKLKGPFLDAVTEVWGPSKNHQWKSDTWRWNGLMDEAIREKCVRFQICSALKKEAWRWRPRGKNYLHWHLARKVWGREKKKSPQYPQMVIVFSISPNRWTARTRTLLVRTVCTMILVSLRSLTTTRWHGLSTMLGCTMSSLSGQATSSLRSL